MRPLLLSLLLFASLPYFSYSLKWCVFSNQDHPVRHLDDIDEDTPPLKPDPEFTAESAVLASPHTISIPNHPVEYRNVYTMLNVHSLKEQNKLVSLDMVLSLYNRLIKGFGCDHVFIQSGGTQLGITFPLYDPEAQEKLAQLKETRDQLTKKVTALKDDFLKAQTVIKTANFAMFTKPDPKAIQEVADATHDLDKLLIAATDASQKAVQARTDHLSFNQKIADSSKVPLDVFAKTFPQVKWFTSACSCTTHVKTNVELCLPGANSPLIISYALLSKVTALPKKTLEVFSPPMVQKKAEDKLWYGWLSLPGLISFMEDKPGAKLLAHAQWLTPIKTEEDASEFNQALIDYLKHDKLEKRDHHIILATISGDRVLSVAE